MKVKYNSRWLYVLVLGATLFISMVYLFISHERIRTKRYVFTRNIADSPKAEIISTETMPVQHGNNSKYKILVGDQECLIKTITIDSMNIMSAVVKSESLSIPAGIYKYDCIRHKVDTSECLTEFNLPDQYDDTAQRLLAYDGVFFESEDYITFNFLLFPDIYVLTKDGRLVTHLKTKDGAPAPHVVKYKEFNTLDQGNAYYTNAASFVIGEKLYVLSFLCPKQLGKYTIDCYDMGTKEYEYSFYVENDSEEDNTFVREIKVAGNVVIITTEKNRTKFKIL